MAAKLIDLSFTLNGRKVKVQIAPDTMLFALLREQGCASVRCACETTNCGLCTVLMDGKPENSEGTLTVAALTSLVFGVKTAEEICADGDAVMSDRMKEELDKIIPLSQIYLNETV